MKRLMGIAALLVAGTGGFLAWQWLTDVTVAEIVIRGERYAAESDLRDLMAVDTGMVMFDLDADILADRVRRHPWIADADVGRLPSGRLMVDVVEREPVAQAVSASGRPDYYFDRNGYRMPRPDSAWYDVVLVSGLREPFHPVTPVAHPALSEMLMLLPELPEETDALLSEIEVDGDDLQLRLTPSGRHQALPVRLGSSGFEPKLRNLTAFWEREILRRQDTDFRLIDLRFKNQVVTREVPR
jgi:cell division protein FtsQ